jgi:hypothetical protein
VFSRHGGCGDQWARGNCQRAHSEYQQTAGRERRQLAYFVEKLADTIASNIDGGRLTTTRCAIVDPGPF